MKLPRLLLTSSLLIFCLLVTTQAQVRNLTEDHRVHRNFASKFSLKNKVRDLIVSLPPGYDTDKTRRYPVLYMHDGLGTFTQWRLDETITALVLNKQMEPIILVCVPNGGTHDDRFEEYTPTKDPQEKAGGHADDYGRMLIEEIKPLIDAEYRTLDGPQNTALGGVSLGGLATLYLGLKYPQVYGKLAVMSPSLWWDNRMIFSRVKSLNAKPPLRIWLDVGTAEGSLNSVKELRDVLKRKGWVLEADLRYYEAKDARHLEEDFARRAALVMKFLFPPVSQNSGLR